MQEYTRPEETEDDEQTPARPRISLGSLKMPAMCGGGVAGATSLISAVSHFGLTGGIALTAVAAVVAWRHGPDLIEACWSPRPTLQVEEEEQPAPLTPPGGRRTLGQRLMGKPGTPAPAPLVDDLSLISRNDTVTTVEPEFTQALTGAASTCDVPRITIEQIARHTTRNSYEVYIGRSLTRPGAPAVKVNFYKRHLKIVGATQHGKSSMAAAFLEAIVRTHDPDRVQIALLDLENKTSRLLASFPHLLEVMLEDGAIVQLHARTHQEVLLHLEYLVGLIAYRYTLSEQEIEELPLVIAYLEEFIDLKDYFKQRIDTVDRAERAQAVRDYERLIYCIKHITRRGLKVLVQLLLCAQVDYRDEDLQEALVNVTAGMSFCLRPSAAQAAGFQRGDLLKRNAAEDQIGQAVAEMPDCKDLILTPEYPLGERLKALAQQERRQRQQRLQLAGKSSREVPIDDGMPHLSVVAPSRGSSQEVPQMEPAAPAEQTEGVPLDFQPRDGDLLLSEVQAQVFLAYYQHCRNISDSLAQIKNDRGQGLGARYFRHASYLLEQQGLKRRRA